MQEEQEWLQLMKETENIAEEVSPAAATLGDAHILGAASQGRAAADPSSLTNGSDALPSGAHESKVTSLCVTSGSAELHTGR